MDNTYRKLFNLDFENFYKLVNKYELDIDQEHLFIIYNLIQNNRYALKLGLWLDAIACLLAIIAFLIFIK